MVFFVPNKVLCEQGWASNFIPILQLGNWTQRVSETGPRSHSKSVPELATESISLVFQPGLCSLDERQYAIAKGWCFILQQPLWSTSHQQGTLLLKMEAL